MPVYIAVLAATSAILILVAILLAVKQKALRASERRFRGFFENSPLPLWEEDFSALKRRIDAERAEGERDWVAFFARDGVVREHLGLMKVVDVNQAALDLLGYSNKASLLVDLAKVIDPDDHAHLHTELEILARGGRSYQGKTFHIDAAGRRLPVSVKLQILPGCEESWERVLVSVVDLSERARAEDILRGSIEQKELLLREINHRVKNNLQIVCSLLHLQLDGGELPPQARASLVDAEARVRSMALVHDILYRSEDLASVEFSTYLSSLLGYLSAAYCGDRDIDLSVEADQISLPLDRAIPCGLLVNELVLNSIKHAFPGGRSGRIEIKMKRAGEGRVLLSVGDDGVGLPATHAEGSASGDNLGVALAGNLANQLGGVLRGTAAPGGGAAFSLEFASGTEL